MFSFILQSTEASIAKTAVYFHWSVIDLFCDSRDRN